ncbi:MAG: 2-oxoacid:ferredoxin oxidoreductase subunit beta [Chloroflexi bacterium]|nr:2-oxoacid:ferredoxin oxidoreductase subunit beta [Chloroflexota bacterium]
MVETAALTLRDYRTDVKPIWCPGCGDFGVLSSTHKALVQLQLRPENVVIASGIGCSSRLPYFVKTYGIHGLHGRSLPLATGMKLARPDLTVLAYGGDGDMFSIGTGHTPHAARRNVDITAVCMDNQIYGLTKAQTSPTSVRGYKSKSTPYGSPDEPLNPVLLALASGASFVARAYSARAKELTDLLIKGIQHKGFAFIHVKSPCVEFINTYDMLDRLVEEMPVDHDPSDLQAAMNLAVTEEKVHVGVFYESERPVYEEVAHSWFKPTDFDADAFFRRF